MYMPFTPCELVIGTDSSGLSTTVIAAAGSVGAVTAIVITISVILLFMLIANKRGLLH